MAEGICSDPECELPVRVRGMCNRHYHQARKRGELVMRVPAQRLAGPGQRQCQEPDCACVCLARGMCRYHYNAAWRRGELPLDPHRALSRERHILTDVDREARTADCSVCGSNVRVRLRSARVECRRRKRKRPGASSRRSAIAGRYRSYDITLADYEAMVVAQGGTCTICHKPPKGKLVVDHDHKTGRVRGLLCGLCNSAIGFLRDDADAALRASMYLVQK